MTLPGQDTYGHRHVLKSQAHYSATNAKKSFIHISHPAIPGKNYPDMVRRNAPRPDFVNLTIKDQAQSIGSTCLILHRAPLLSSRPLFVLLLTVHSGGNTAELRKSRRLPACSRMPAKRSLPSGCRRRWDDARKSSRISSSSLLRRKPRIPALGGPHPQGSFSLAPSRTGKTLLARALAGEANVPFSPSHPLTSSKCASVRRIPRPRLSSAGARDALHQSASTEIDARLRATVAQARRRHDEREQTLTSVLARWTAFESNDGVTPRRRGPTAPPFSIRLLRPCRLRSPRHRRSSLHPWP